MKTYDMLENNHDGLTAFDVGEFEKILFHSMCDSEKLTVYTFTDGLKLRFSKDTYQRRIDKALRSYIRVHGEPVSIEEVTITRSKPEVENNA